MANTQMKHPHHDLIQAYLNGETIQTQMFDGSWSDLKGLETQKYMPPFQHDFQDKVYGMFVRVWNLCKGGASARCTVCGVQRLLK